MEAWAVNPVDGYPEPSLAAERVRLQTWLANIEAAGDEADCRLCGRLEQLTEEHTPSRRAGNLPRAVQVTIDPDRSAALSEFVWVSGSSKVALGL
jgi:hypothetical protein